MELYVHIPFCVKKCKYCDFLSAPANESLRGEYIEALIREIYALRGLVSAKETVSSVFLGGGTPSVLESSQILRIFRALSESFPIAKNAEITMEMNPGTASDEKLKAIKEAGVNRLSIGLQSADDRDLILLGRIHTFAGFLKTFKAARQAGFANINVDLISAIPGQTLESWENTLIKTAGLKPEHISAYSLIIEEGTFFFDIYGKGDKSRKDLYAPLPDEDTERKMYEVTEDLLEKYGYHRYEISNYAKIGFECRHNIGYWQRANYLGIGLGASSLLNNVRFHNTKDLSFYLQNSSIPKAIRKDVQELPISEQIEEFMFLGLRMTCGISVKDFQKNFKVPIEEVYGEKINTMIHQGLLQRNKDFLMLTHWGIDVSNQVFVEFMDPRI